ncbi:DUF2268 domain-containing protein [Colwellia sp. D2M02]|uniref:DUF2268 domain-containing putative Zn-dependent protease n=1 Tax=Colwellia sp. D2M02 TaxID=2841562 RepID=UPI001C09D651|nr:DUF2268 domain-containing putative Zn-dependent protease [Colwellia sp. D2M02]MBU2893717.1 DUF2268 domain-containing protein [Colwellia sp. D2M02]
MATKINILNASERFSHVLDLLENKAQDSLVEIKKHIELPNIDVVISPCSEEYKTESGILGCVSTPYVIDVLLDTDRKDLSNIINNELTSVIAHELHHVIRTSFGVQEKSLLQVLVSEGLACHFETKFSDDATSKFFADIKKYEWRNLYSKMQANLESTDFNYPVYFGGKDMAKFPNRAGYWVGFNLISEYIDKYGGCAVTLVGTAAEEFVVT